MRLCFRADQQWNGIGIGIEVNLLLLRAHRTNSLPDETNVFTCFRDFFVGKFLYV